MSVRTQPGHMEFTATAPRSSAARMPVTALSAALEIERIERLLGLLPSEARCLAPILPQLGVEGIPPEIDILAHVFNDLGFGWMFVKTFLDLVTGNDRN